MIDIVKVTSVKSGKGFELAVGFSDGTAGIFDFAAMIDEGGSMVAPLREQTFFHRVFIEFGVLTWPNGFDLDAIALHQDMKQRGLLSRAA